MSHIRIEHLEDNWDCDTCGTSWAVGFRVYQDGKEIVELLPSAQCYDGVSYDETDLLKAVLEVLGYTVEITS